MSALDHATAACAKKLDIAPAALAEKFDVARVAGWTGMDAVATAFLAIADPMWDRGGSGGEVADDPVIAAIWRRSPRRERDDADLLGSELRGVDSGWAAHTLPDYDYRLPVARDQQVAALASKSGISIAQALTELRRVRLRELTIDDAAHSLFPGRRRAAEKKRAKFRAAIRARHGVSSRRQRRLSVAGAP